MTLRGLGEQFVRGVGNELEMLDYNAMFYTKAAVEAIAVPAMMRLDVSLGVLGRGLAKNKLLAPVFTTLTGLTLLLTSCGPTGEAPTTVAKLPDDGGKPVVTGGVVETNPTVIPSPTLDVEKFRGEDVELELVTDAKRLAAKSKDFSEGTLVFQTLDVSNNLKPTIKETSVDSPGLDAEYKLLSSFEVKNKKSEIVDEFSRIRSMDGEEFLVIKQRNIETDMDEYIRLHTGSDVVVTGESGWFVPMSFLDGDGKGGINYYYPLAFQKNNKGFTGLAVYGEDLDTYSEMKLGNGFTAKRAMMTQQLEDATGQIDKLAAEQGMTEYNYGIDEVSGGLFVYSGNGLTFELKNGELVYVQPAPESVPTPPVAELPAYFSDLSIEKANIDIKTKEDIAKIPEIKWEDIKNGNFAKWIKEQYRLGNIKHFDSKAKPFRIKLVSSNDSIIQKFGFGPMFESAIRINPDKEQPIKPVGMFKSHDDFERELLIVPHVANNGITELEGGDPWVLIQESPWVDIFKNPATLSKTKDSMLKIDGEVVTPVRFKDLQSCIGVTNDYKGLDGFCEEYFNGRYQEINKLVNEWLKTATMPVDFESTPFWGTTVPAR